MYPGDTRSTRQADTQALLAQGKALAKQDKRKQAHSRFARVLALQSDHVEALMWLAALAPVPQQSVHYLNRALEVSPGNLNALAGLKWARQRLRSAPRFPPDTGSSQQEPIHWLDKLLLSGIALVCIAACIILFTMAWYAPEAVRAAYQPTATFTVTPTATATRTPISTPTPTPTSTAVPPTATPTATILAPSPRPTATRVVNGEPSSATALGAKRIELDLSEQRLYAYEGETPVYSALVSTGVPSMPTPKGTYRIYLKIRSQTMSGPGYSLPNVEFVAYFYKSYALHGTYWHNNFGQQMSHGCVNMTNTDAKWIYAWAPKGTPVHVRQ